MARSKGKLGEATSGMGGGKTRECCGLNICISKLRDWGNCTSRWVSWSYFRTPVLQLNPDISPQGNCVPHWRWNCLNRICRSLLAKKHGLFQTMRFKEQAEKRFASLQNLQIRKISYYTVAMRIIFPVTIRQPRLT